MEDNAGWEVVEAELGRCDTCCTIGAETANDDTPLKIISLRVDFKLFDDKCSWPCPPGCLCCRQRGRALFPPAPRAERPLALCSVG
jgi:hypothetical protein